MIQKKPWYTSKILWVNIVAFIIEVVEIASTAPVFPPWVHQVILTALPALNIILRFMTFQPITESGEDRAEAARHSR